MAVTFLFNAGELAEPSAVAYTEVENFGEKEWSASVVVMCPWADRQEVRANILNNRCEWPYFPNCRMYAETASIAPMPSVQTGTDGSGNSYPYARITVTYKRNLEDGEQEGQPGGGASSDGNTASYTESLELNGEMLRIPPDDLFWLEGASETFDRIPLTQEEAPAKIMLGAEYIFSWKGLSYLPDGLMDKIDHVNSDSVTSELYGYTFAPETLLLNGPRLSRSKSANAEISKIDCELRWSWRKNGWNKFWRCKSETFETIHKVATGGIFEEGGYTDFIPFPSASMASLLPEGYASS